LSKRRSPGPDGLEMMLTKIRSLTEDILTSLGQLQRNLTTHLDQAERELTQVRVETDRLRLVPASELFAALERSVRDAAQSLQKRVELKTFGGETGINAHVLGEIRSALFHAVRNSVAHGIESESERRVAGKPPVGTVALSVERRGNRAAFICKDDGRGIDVAAVRLVAVRRNLISPAEAASLRLDDAIQLILKEGLTTMGEVTEVSGRGIGLDVVQEVVRRLKGFVALRSEPGQGTTLELCVPVSLSSLPALVTDVEGSGVCLPLDAVRGSLHLVYGDIARSAENNSIVYEGRLVPFVPLARLLGRESLRAHSHWSAVMIQAESDVVALGVDRLLGITDVVVRPLPSWIAADPIVAGAALDRKGHPQLVLDPTAVMVAARARPEGHVETTASRPPVLIIDDSLTTRMLEQSILESAGYQVELAISGEDGIAKARRRKYGLFVVDIEMPGVDGFEFLRQTQSDPMLRDIPSILVTSRNSAEDQLRGKELGAHAYIVKSEFDQGFLLKTLRDLIG
ncbi:MAG: response regulator, partial [Acidobacteria bacterium]|nr:response regulator [Acidobacteriota bacterium]